MRINFLHRRWRGLACLLGLVVLALAMLANAAVAVWIGFQDLLWPVSLSAQFSGLFLFIAGLVSLAGLFGVFPLLRKALALINRKDTGHMAFARPFSFARSFTFVASAAMAGLYIDLTIVFYSLHYKTVLVSAFSVLATVCACSAGITLPVIWKGLSKGLKATGISLALLGALVQFWYQNVYVPENTPVGMIYTVTVGSVVQEGSEKLLQVNLTMEDAGAIPSVDLGSMVIVSGTNNSGHSTILSVMQPFGDDSYFFPDDTISYEFIVIAGPGIYAVHVELLVDVALTTKLTLDQPGTLEGLQHCPQGTFSEWYVSVSNLRRFTRGRQVLWSDWCPSYVDPYINVGISGLRGGRLVSIPESFSNPIRDTSRSDTLLLG